MDGQSLDIKKEALNKLKEIIPNCFTEDKIDWEKLKVFFEDNIEFKNERYHLNWAGKTNAIRLLQAPTYNTLKPCKEESVNFDTTENLFIEGDNLEVLKILQKSYFGKIKMIYIDPPYNTGNDFIYRDDYSETLTEYRKKVGDVDENGNATRAGLFKNTKENGQYHSNWLNMMYPRLFLARNLLRDDGVIFVSIDDNEVHNLRLMMDEIFGEENFVSIVTRKTKSFDRDKSSKELQNLFDFMLIYCKNKSNLKLNQDIVGVKEYPYLDEKGYYKLNPLQNTGPHAFREVRPKTYYPIFYTKNGEFSLDRKSNEDIEFLPRKIGNKDGTWSWSKEKVLKEMDKLVIKNNQIFVKIYEQPNMDKNKYQSKKNLLLDYDNAKGSLSLNSLDIKNIFSNPKPVELIKWCLSISTFSSSSDLILDFFAGSGTTAHAVMELNKEDGGNRKFILVQLPEPTDPESEAYKAGYKTIADIARERIRRAAKKIEQELQEEAKKKAGELPLEQREEKPIDLGFKVFKLDESNFKQWRPFKPENPEQIKQSVIDFSQNVKPEATTENMLYELMLKNGKKLTDKVEKKHNFYVVNNNELVLLLEEINKETIDEVMKLKPLKVVALDKIFNNNDQLKTNTVLQFKDAGIEFKSV
ncbi:MAG: site-specific DNA-methyltransferase [candidate division WOR-3 bacterium]